MSPAPLEVRLPVCDECGLIGKRPVVPKDAAQKCVGPRGGTHKIRRMRTVVFREVVDDAAVETPEAATRKGGAAFTADGLKEYACPICGGAVWMKPRPGRPPRCDACKPVKA